MWPWVLVLTLQGGGMVGCWSDTDKLVGLPRGGVLFPGGTVHVLVPWQRVAMTSSAALLCLKGLANGDHLSWLQPGLPPWSLKLWFLVSGHAGSCVGPAGSWAGGSVGLLWRNRNTSLSRSVASPLAPAARTRHLMDGEGSVPKSARAPDCEWDPFTLSVVTCWKSEPGSPHICHSPTFHAAVCALWWTDLVQEPSLKCRGLRWTGKKRVLLFLWPPLGFWQSFFAFSERYFFRMTPWAWFLQLYLKL